MIKYEFKPVDLKTSIILGCTQISLEIQSAYFRYIVDNLVSEAIDDDDISRGYKEAKRLSDIVVLKRLISSIVMKDCDNVDEGKDNVYMIVVSATGAYDDIRMFFESKKECYEMYMELLNWWLIDFEDNKRKKQHDSTKDN
jgi:hypothetical protein